MVIVGVIDKLIFIPHLATLAASCLCNCKQLCEKHTGIMLNFTLRRLTGVSIRNLNQLTPTISSLGQILPRATMSQEAGQYPPIESAMRKALNTELKPVYLEVINESPQHNVPKRSESHFRVFVVSEKFNDLTLIKVC